MGSISMPQDGHSTCFTRQTPHFFKIILEETIREEKLRIPTTFVQQYGEDLDSDHVILQAPNSAEWEVKLTKAENGNIWLQQGFSKFVKYYNLGHGNLLVFSPLGNSKFDVMIFDMSAMEITYPSPPNRLAKNIPHEDSHNPKNSQTRNAKEKFPVQSRGSRKRKRVRDSTEGSLSPENKASQSKPFFKSTQHDTLKCKKMKKDAGFRSSIVIGGGGTGSNEKHRDKDAWKTRCLSHGQKSKLLEKTKDFLSTEPHFKVVIQPSAIYSDDKIARLIVPAEFARDHFTDMEGNVVLHTNWRTWFVNYKKYLRERHSNITEFRLGWNEFARDQRLSVGDVCVFEMIRTSTIVLNVYFYRADEVSKCSPSPGTKSLYGKASKSSPSAGVISSTQIHKYQSKEGRTRCFSREEKVRILERAQFFQSTNPHFKVVIQPSAVFRGSPAKMSVPSKFANTYLRSKGNAILEVQDVDKKRTWSVRYSSRLSGHNNFIADFRTGWEKFSLDNTLEIGDLCIFELIDIGACVFEVLILRKQ